MPKKSSLTNHSLGELQIGEKTGAMVLAIRTKEGKFDTTPSAQDRLLPDDTLIVLGTREQVARLETLMTGKDPINENPEVPFEPDSSSTGACRKLYRDSSSRSTHQKTVRKSVMGRPKVAVRIGR